MIKQSYLDCYEDSIFFSAYITDKISPKANLIIIPSIGWYYVGPNRLFVQIAEECNEKGINVFLFDYIGQGESSGDYTKMKMNSMIEAIHTIYKYVEKHYGSLIYAMGYGVGNLLLAICNNKLLLKKQIYYLPEFSYRECLNSLLTTVKDKYEFSINDEQNYLLNKALFGPLHDCTYNPVSMEFLKELYNLGISNIKKLIDKPNVLIISDNNEFYSKATVYYYIEFNKNKFPRDWYKSVNLWPATLEKVNREISNWLSQENVEESQHVCINYGNKEIIREIVTVDNENEKINAVLHYAKGEEKVKYWAVFIPGLGGDRIDNYSCGPRIGDYFASRRMNLLRYDNRYAGGSSKMTQGYNWTDVINDTLSCLYILQKRYNAKNMFLIAWSAGAKIASYLVNRQIEFGISIKGCCFWNPVIFDEPQKMSVNNGTVPKYTKNRKKEIVTQLGGEYLGLQYARDNQKYDFMKEWKEMQVPYNVIWGSKETESKSFDFIKKEKCDQVLVKADSHLFSYSLMEDLFNITFLEFKKDTEAIFNERL